MPLSRRTGREEYVCLRVARWAPGQGPRLAAGPRLAVAGERAGAWGTLCAVAGDQSDVWRGDDHRGQRSQGGAVLRDVSRNRHQWPTAYTSVETAPLDRALFPDPQAPASDWGLPGAKRRCLLRSSRIAPHGLFCLDVHLTGGMPRAAHDGGDHFQFEALLALCGL